MVPRFLIAVDPTLEAAWAKIGAAVRTPEDDARVWIVVIAPMESPNY